MREIRERDGEGRGRERAENNQVTFEWSFSKVMVDINNIGVTKSPVGGHQLGHGDQQVRREERSRVES